MPWASHQTCLPQHKTLLGMPKERTRQLCWQIARSTSRSYRTNRISPGTQHTFRLWGTRKEVVLCTGPLWLLKFALATNLVISAAWKRWVNVRVINGGKVRRWKFVCFSHVLSKQSCLGREVELNKEKSYRSFYLLIHWSKENVILKSKTQLVITSM